MDASPFQFDCRLARNPAEVRAAQRLRYQVFVAELGGGGPGVDHARGLETDSFDRLCEHLLLFDRARGPDRVVGVYRLLDSARLPEGQPYYTESEYDLAPLRRSRRRLMELGRSCLHPDCRGGAGMVLMWSALAQIVQERGIEILFGTASFHGTDIAALAEPLAQLHHAHLAPPGIRPASLVPQRMDLVAPAEIDRARAMRAVPALIKAYLRLGGFVGEGAFVDRAFNTTDVCLVLDVARMSGVRRAICSRGLPEASPAQ